MDERPHHDGLPDVTCATCRHFCDDREQVERELTGLLILSSAFGDAWGDAGICRLHDTAGLPFHTCANHTLGD